MSSQPKTITRKTRFLKPMISCQNQRSKHLNFNYIYLISYKIAKKANLLKKICPLGKRYHRFLRPLIFTCS